MDHILYQVQDNLAMITLNRPEVANGFHIPMCQEILEALELAEKDASVSFVLINAAGKVFSVGGDLVEMKRAVEKDDISSLTQIAELVNTISYKIKQIPKPVIMEVDGAVAGAAANMALAVDFCIASDRAKFIQAFVGVGLAPDAGGLFLLTRSLGAIRATQLAMTGEAFTAEKALEAGVVYRLCASDQLEKTREQLLKKLRRGSSNSYAVIKELVWESEFKQWHEYAKLELKLQETLSYTEDFKEGVRAHSERRRPKFMGK
ncbi:enoyl-CoA hydratase [Streptococcus infantis]|uniref:enoyl-CoA hydratase n=1 Tax=Streptococcus infantis TaxID=68892 RepID=UPI0039C031D2